MGQALLAAGPDEKRVPYLYQLEACNVRILSGVGDLRWAKQPVAKEI